MMQVDNLIMYLPAMTASTKDMKYFRTKMVLELTGDQLWK